MINKDLFMKNQTYQFLNYNINIKNFDQNNTKIDEKSYKNILVYYTVYMTIKDSKYI